MNATAMHIFKLIDRTKLVKIYIKTCNIKSIISLYIKSCIHKVLWIRFTSLFSVVGVGYFVVLR